MVLRDVIRKPFLTQQRSSTARSSIATQPPRALKRRARKCSLLCLLLGCSLFLHWAALSPSDAEDGLTDVPSVGVFVRQLMYWVDWGRGDAKPMRNDTLSLSAVSHILSQPYASNVIVSEELRLMYCPVPKVASSNWKYVIRKLEGHDNYDDLRAANNVNTSGLRYLSDYSAAEAQALLQPGTMFKFTFLRDPYVRLLSAYMDKLRRGSGPDYRGFVAAAFSWRVARDVIDADPNNGTHNGQIIRPSFRAFATAISQHDPYSTDHHWQPQTNLCGLDAIRYDFIGRMESIDADAQIVFNRIGHPFEKLPSPEDIGFPPSGASTPGLASRMYTTDLLFLTRALYARDFDHGGY